MNNGGNYMNTIHNIYSPDMILMANELVKQALRNLGIYDRLAAVEEACNIDPPSPPEQEPENPPAPTGTPINLTSASWTLGATYGSQTGEYNTSSSTWMCTGKKDCDSTTYKYVKITWSNASELSASVHFFKGNDGATWIKREQLITSEINVFDDGVAVLAIPDDTTKIAFVAGMSSGSGYTPVATDVSDFAVELFEEDPS